jgi:hypothetical protein
MMEQGMKSGQFSTNCHLVDQFIVDACSLPETKVYVSEKVPVLGTVVEVVTRAPLPVVELLQKIKGVKGLDRVFSFFLSPVKRAVVYISRQRTRYGRSESVTPANPIGLAKPV